MKAPEEPKKKSPKSRFLGIIKKASQASKKEKEQEKEKEKEEKEQKKEQKKERAKEKEKEAKKEAKKDSKKDKEKEKEQSVSSTRSTGQPLQTSPSPSVCPLADGSAVTGVAGGPAVPDAASARETEEGRKQQKGSIFQKIGSMFGRHMWS